MDPLVAIAHDVATLAFGSVALQPKFAAIAVSSSGDNTIVSAVTAKRIRVLAAKLMANGSVNSKWRSNTTDVTGLDYLVVNVGYVLPFCPVGWFQTVVGEPLVLNLSGAVAVGGHITYVEVTD